MKSATRVRPSWSLGLFLVAAVIGICSSTLHAAPTVAITGPVPDATNTGPVTYTVTYTGATDVTLSTTDITLNTEGTATGTVSVSGTGTDTRTVRIDSITGDGKLGITIAPGTSTDGTDVDSGPSGPSDTVTIDNTPPIIGIGDPSVSATSGGPVTYTVTYGGANAVTLSESDITLNKTGTANGTVAVTGEGVDARTVTISGITGDGTLGISIKAGSAVDYAGNPAPAAGPSKTSSVDNTKPTLSVGDPSAASTVTGPVTYAVTYSGASTVNLKATDITLNKSGTADGTVSVTDGTTTAPTVTVDSITGTGTLGITIKPGTAADDVGNTDAGAGPGKTFNVVAAGTKPAVAIGAPSATTTNTGPITYTVTYTNATAVSLSKDNVTLNKTGTASGTVAVSGSGTDTRTVTISSITGDGTLGISIAAGTAAGTGGTVADASADSTTFAVDNTGPAIAISDPSAASNTGTGTVTYTVTYTGASAVTLAVSDITLNKSGTASGTVAVSGTGTATRTVTISGIVGVGKLGITIGSGTASDALGNKSAATDPSKTFDANNTTAPALSISVPSKVTTTTDAVTFTITYTGATSISLAAKNITLNKTGTASGTVAVTGDGTTTRTVTISSLTGTGSLGISIAAGTATNSTSKKSAPQAGPSYTFNVNLAQPSVTIGSPSVTLANVGPVTYKVTYLGAAAITLAANDVTLNKTGSANGTVGVTFLSATERTVTISNITGTGTLGISLKSGTAVDRGMNASLAAGPSTTFNVDPAPFVTIGPPSKTTTTAGPITYTVAYAGASAVTLTKDDVTLNTTSTAYGTVAVSGTGTATRTVTISNITGNGKLGISLAAGTANAGSDHQAPKAGPSATFAVANTAPAITIGSPSVTTTDIGPVDFNVNYSGVTSVTLATSNVTLVSTGDADGTVTVGGTGTSSRKVTISGITGNGTLAIKIASGTGANAAKLKTPEVTSTAFTVYSKPSVTISDPSLTLTNTGPVTYTVTYARESAITLSKNDITLNTTGDAKGDVAVSNGADSHSKTVTISNITGNGTLGITLDDSTAKDGTDHPAPAPAASKTFNVHAGPLVSIGDPSATTTDGTTPATVTYTVTYQDATAISLDEPDVTLNTTGTANGTVAISGTGTATRTVTISSITGKGTLGITLAAATASDGAKNTCLAAGPSKTFNVNNPIPALVISAPAATSTTKGKITSVVTTSTVSGPITYTITYSNATSVTLAAKDITLNKTGSATGTIAVGGTGTTTRTVTISNISGHGTLGISIAEKTASNAAKQTAPACGPSATCEVDLAVPYVAISDPSAWLTLTGPVNYTVTYVGASEITLTKDNVILNSTGAASGTVTVSGEGTSTRTVTIDSITGTGSLSISLAAGTAARATGAKALAVGPSEVFYTNLKAPAIEISDPSVLSSNGTVPIVYTVTYFGASAITLDEPDITVNGTGTASATAAVSGTGTTTRLVTLSNIKGVGTLSISIGKGTATDADGHASDAYGPSAVCNAANTAPAVVISDPSVASTTAGPVTYTINYSGVNSIKLDGTEATTSKYITVNKTGSVDGGIAVTGTGTSSRTVTLSSLTGTGSVGISVAAGSGSNASKVATIAAGPSKTCLVNVTGPLAVISPPSTQYTATGPVTYTVNYLLVNDVSLTADDITLNTTGDANGSIAVTGSGISRTVTISNITGTGTLGISIAKDTGTGDGGVKTAAVGPSATFNVHPAPTITITGPFANGSAVTNTTTGPVTYTVTYSGATDVTLAAKDITLNKKGTATGTVTVTTPTSSWGRIYGDTAITRTVTISKTAGTGSLSISIGAGTATDSANHVSAVAAGPSKTININLSAPTATISAPTPAATKAGPVAFTVSYLGADKITLGSDQVTLVKDGTVDVKTKEVTGSGTDSRTVTLSDISGNGTLGITIGTGTALDRDNHPALAPTQKTGNVATIDDTCPTVSVGTASKSITNTGPVTYTVTYSGVDSGGAITLTKDNVTLNKTGTADGAVAVSGTTGATRTVTISGIHGEGSLGITIAAGTAKDAAGNLATKSADSNPFYVSNTPPTVTIGEPSAKATATQPVTYTVTYSGATVVTLTTGTTGNLKLDKTGTATGTLSVSGTGTDSRTVTIDKIGGTGTLGISIAAGSATDAPGNKSVAVDSKTFIVDNSVPSVAIGAPSVTATNKGPVTFTITYTNCTDISLKDNSITPNYTGGVTADVAVSGTDTTTRTVTFSNIQGDGTLGFSIPGGTGANAAGTNAHEATSATVTVDNTKPTITIGKPSADSANNGDTITYTITYTGATAISLADADVHVVADSGNAAATAAVSGTGTTTRTVTLTNITGSGALYITIDANTATDAVGNKADTAGPSDRVVVIGS